MAAQNLRPQPKVMSSRTLKRLAHWSGKVCDRPHISPYGAFDFDMEQRLNLDILTAA